MAARPTRSRRLPGVQPHDRRFRRARSRADGGRPWRWRIWHGVKLVTAALALGGAGWFVHDVATSSVWFTVQTVRVAGIERMARGEVDALLHGLHGRNTIVTPLDPWRDRLMSSPWVEQVTLRRALPAAIDVTIVERRPVALARVGRTLHLVDRHGTFIDEFGPRYATLDLPLVDGLTTADGDGSRADASRMALAFSVLGELADAGLLWRVSQLDVSRPHDAVVLLNEDPALLHLGRERFAERLQSYVDMSRRLQTMVADVEYVDLRFEDRVYLRPRRAGFTFTSATAAAPPPEADLVDEPGDVPDQE
jgi:cell division protein FtsQ